MTRKLDGFVHYSFDGPVEHGQGDFPSSITSFNNNLDGRVVFAGLSVVDDTATILSTSESTDTQDSGKPATDLQPEGAAHHDSGSQSNSEITGTVRSHSQPLSSLSMDHVGHDRDDSHPESADNAAATAQAPAAQAPVAQAAALMTVRESESESNHEFDFEDFIIWPEDQI